MKSALAASLCLLLPAGGAVLAPPSSRSVARTTSPLPASAARRARPWGMHQSLSSIRGGALLTDEYDESDDELISDVESDEEELSDAELSNLEVDEEADEAETEPAAATSASGPPVKLSIKTALQSELIDQRLEFTASRKRTVLSLRQAVAKTMRGRPPLSCVILKHHGRTLDDEETVDDILEEVDEEDEEEGDAEDDIGEEEDAVKVGLTCDMVPPVDAKFGIELREKVGKMSTRELVEAYCANMAGMVYGQELQAKEEEVYEREEAGETLDEQEEGDEEGEGGEAPPPMMAENHSLEIRKRAARIQRQFEGTLAAETRQLIDEEHARVKEATSASDGDGEAIYGLAPHSSLTARSVRKGRTLKGGAAMNIKRTLQRNLNVHWADTFRNSLLFLFFGYFGGRNSFSRTFLLLGSPLCFFLQTRPVKVAMKRVFYTMGEPPGILLSLLPAPQQAIMSLDYGRAMRGLYGETALEGEAWVEAERAEDDDEGFGGGWGLDEDEDEYDDDDGYDAEYDSDDEY